MQLDRPQREHIKRLLLERHTDWAGVHIALKQANGRAISQSSLERFFNGSSNSPRTLRHVALLLNTTSEALLASVRQLAAQSPRGRPRSSAARFRDPEAYRVAYQLWVEMTTRKVGLPIDLAHDLIGEIYDSWYAFFREARGLIKQIPIHRDPTCPQLRQLVQVSHAVLNDGLRPHLEKWQGQFRHWQRKGGDESQSPGLTPQQSQALFPEWSQLSSDILASNRKLIGYLGALEQMLGYPATIALLAPKKKKRPVRTGRRAV